MNNGELRFGLPAALIVLLLVVGTLGASIPMAMAVISIIVALGLTALVGQVFELNLFITNMVVAMGLALGIDYSLFIVARLREERARGADTQAAILTVAGTATRAVVFSGSAFVLAMSAMLLVPDTTLRSLGLGAVLVGVVSVLVALTFHPALLDGPRRPRRARPYPGAAAQRGESRARRRLADGRAPPGALARRGRADHARAGRARARPADGLRLLAARQRGRQAGPGGTAEGLRSRRDGPVEIVVDGRGESAAAGGETAAGGESGGAAVVARLRATLARDRDFAIAGLTVEHAADVTAISVPLTVEPSSKRASAAVDRLRDPLPLARPTPVRSWAARPRRPATRSPSTPRGCRSSSASCSRSASSCSRWPSARSRSH